MSDENRITFRFRKHKDDDLKEALDKECERTGLDRNNVTRLALRHYLGLIKKEKADEQP